MNPICILHANIFTMENPVPIEDGYLTFSNGKITGIGNATDAPIQTHEVVDAKGSWMFPGLIDAHTHLGVFEDSLGFEGADGNEDTDPITPHLRVLDAIHPMDRSFAEARSAGVTTVVVTPGSANPIGGQMLAMKTVGRRVDDMIIRAPLAMKFALGENPKSVYHDKEETPVTRMATAALIRETLRKAQEYAKQKQEAMQEEDKDPPEFDAKLEALLPVLSGEITAHFHAHRTDDIFTALRIAREFALRPVIVHGTEAHLVADILASEQVPIISGPSMTDRSKPELANLTERAPAMLHQAGISLAITTDHPEFPVKYLLDAVRFAVRAGLAWYTAIEAVTLQAARIAEIDHRVGSLAVGKDADFFLCSGDPLDYRTHIQAVYCNGALIGECL